MAPPSSKIFSKRYHPPGTSPGTLTARVSETPLEVRLIRYTEHHYEESQPDDIAAVECDREQEGVSWLHLQGGVSTDALHDLSRIYGLHLLALEDVANRGQRAKLEEYEDRLFVILHLPLMAEDSTMTTEQVSLFVGSGFVVSLCDAAYDPFEPVRVRLRDKLGKLRKRGSDYLLYAIIDDIVDEAFPLLESYGEYLEYLEDEVMNQPGRDYLSKIHQLRRDLLLIRRALWPQREALSRLVRDDLPSIQEETRVYLRDCHDHTVQILDLIESYREMATSLLEVYLSSVSNRLNETMRLLTIIATVFIPLTFIVGVYGMNFGNNSTARWAMPELRWEYGYPMVWLLMVLVAAMMLYLFKRKKWF